MEIHIILTNLALENCKNLSIKYPDTNTKTQHSHFLLGIITEAYAYGILIVNAKTLKDS